MCAPLKFCCRKGDAFQGLRVGSCLTLSNEWPRETHVLIKQEIIMGKEYSGRERQSKATQENCPATRLTVPALMEMGVVSGLFLANWGPFLVARAVLNQDGFQQTLSSWW